MTELTIESLLAQLGEWRAVGRELTKKRYYKLGRDSYGICVFCNESHGLYHESYCPVQRLKILLSTPPGGTENRLKKLERFVYDMRRLSITMKSQGIVYAADEVDKEIAALTGAGQEETGEEHDDSAALAGLEADHQAYLAEQDDAAAHAAQSGPEGEWWQ